MFSFLSEWLTFERDHRSTVLLSFIVAGGLLCFLTMAAKQSLVENTNVAEAIRNGSKFHIAISISISLAVPVLLNLIVNICLDNFGTDAKKRKKSTAINNTDIMTDIEKFIFFVGIVIFPITSCFPGSNRAILLATCSSSCQIQLIAGVVLISLHRFDAQYFPTPIVYTLVFLQTVSNLVRPYAINACAILSIADCAALPSYRIQLLFIYIPAILLWGLILFWLISVSVSYVYGEKIHAQYFHWPRWCCYNNIKKKEEAVPAAAKKKSPLDDSLLFFRVSYCLTTIAWILFTGIVKNHAVTFTEFNDEGLMLTVVPHIMFEVSVIFFGLRLVQHEAVVALLALIEAKKTYVRYISHELRTPLSAANSGLQMLHAELSVTARTNPVDEERLDTLTDVCSAIQTTVDILNDLLTFEKMDSGKNSPIDSLLDLI